jgi:hypothetical protein
MGKVSFRGMACPFCFSNGTLRPLTYLHVSELEGEVLMITAHRRRDGVHQYLVHVSLDRSRASGLQLIFDHCLVERQEISSGVVTLGPGTVLIFAAFL